jgi:hypothetical protein
MLKLSYLCCNKNYYRRNLCVIIFQIFSKMSLTSTKFAEESLFELCKDERTQLLQSGKFFDELNLRGIRKNDPRVSLIVNAIEEDDEKKINKEKFAKYDKT